MEPPTHAPVIADLQNQQATRPLSILALAEPILALPPTASQDPADKVRQSDASTNSSTTDHPTPASLAADLAHYKDLFSKLRFSYLEQVTKEKFLRSIVGDPPLLVSHADNSALEDELAITKAELKAKKDEVASLVEECEATARDLARRWENVQLQTKQLEIFPDEIASMEARVHDLQTDLQLRMGSIEQSSDPRMNLGLEETNALVLEQQARAKDIEKQIAALQRQLPAKMRECEAVERELETVERRRNEATARAREAQKLKEEGGRDLVEEQVRWYRSAELVLKGLVYGDEPA